MVGMGVGCHMQKLRAWNEFKGKLFLLLSSTFVLVKSRGSCAELIPANQDLMGIEGVALAHVDASGNGR